MTRIGKQLTNRREPNASPAHQSATAAFVYHATANAAISATPTSGTRRTSSTRPTSAAPATGVQVTSPCQYENSTSSSAGDPQCMKSLPCGTRNGLPYNVHHTSICGEKTATAEAPQTAVCNSA